MEVLDEAGRVLSGYRVYPAPVHQAGAGNQVAEVFRWDEAAYGANALYPAVAAELSGEYVYRGQVKQRLLLYPLRFNPGAGELVHSERIRVRVAYEDTAAAAAPLRAAAAAAYAAPSPATGWSPPTGAAFKVLTDGEGITRITRDWLTAQGIGPTEIDAINLSTVQLFHLGSSRRCAWWTPTATTVWMPATASYYTPRQFPRRIASTPGTTCIGWRMRAARAPCGWQR